MKILKDQGTPKMVGLCGRGVVFTQPGKKRAFMVLAHHQNNTTRCAHLKDGEEVLFQSHTPVVTWPGAAMVLRG